MTSSSRAGEGTEPITLQFVDPRKLLANDIGDKTDDNIS